MLLRYEKNQITNIHSDVGFPYPHRPTTHQPPQYQHDIVHITPQHRSISTQQQQHSFALQRFDGNSVSRIIEGLWGECISVSVESSSKVLYECMGIHDPSWGFDIFCLSLHTPRTSNTIKLHDIQKTPSQKITVSEDHQTSRRLW